METYSIKEVSKKFQRSQATIYNWVKNGQLEGFMGRKDGFVGRPGIRITEDSVNKLYARMYKLSEEDITNQARLEKIDEMEKMLDKMAMSLKQFQNTIFCMRVGLAQMKNDIKEGTR